jgi:hypothetical protein
MSKSNAFETDLLGLIFNGTAIATIADNAASTPLTNLFLALHTADPGEAGNQSTSEISYTGYSRVAVARTSGGWTVTGNSVSPVAAIEFGEMTGGAGGSVTYASIGTASTGSGKILYSGALTPSITVALGVLPRIKNTSTITED